MFNLKLRPQETDLEKVLKLKYVYSLKKKKVLQQLISTLHHVLLQYTKQVNCKNSAV